MKKQKKTFSTKEFDEHFETEDVSEHLEWDNATKRVNVDFPAWMLKSLTEEAARLQIPRQAVIKMWIDERLKSNRTD